MEEKARAPAGCRGESGPRGWCLCPWRMRASRCPLLHSRPELCPALGDWGKGGILALFQEPPCPNSPRSHRLACGSQEGPVSG